MMAENPFTFKDFDEEKEATSRRNSPMTRVYPGGYVFTVPYKEVLPRIYNLDVKPDDIWVLGLPKSGTTWACELTWGVSHQADLVEAKSTYPYQRWTFVEWNATRKASQYGLDENAVAEINSKAPEYFTCDTFERIEKLKSPRYIKSHLPFSLLPPKLLDTCKVVYIARNLKDVWISMYYFFLGSSHYKVPTVRNVVEEHVQDIAQRSPVCNHVKEAWQRRSHPNLYFLFYEDMIKDLSGVIKKMSSFLEKELSDEQIDKLENHLSFDNMKDNKHANHSDNVDINYTSTDIRFIRKGIAGDWKNHFDADMLEKYNAWWKKHMADCDLKFPED